jgi:Tfp pilus assembly protein FimT
MSRKRRGGFTLIELILVMIVVFTVATVVAPRLSDFYPSFRVRKSGEHLFAWARKARADAGMTGLRQRLVIDPNSRKYWIEFEARPFKEPGKFIPLGGSWGEEQLPDGVRFESMEGTQMDSSRGGCRYVEFRPDGTAADTTLRIVNDRDDRQAIRIEGASSRISIEDQGPGP